MSEDYFCPPHSAIFVKSVQAWSQPLPAPACYHTYFHQGVPAKQTAFRCTGMQHSIGVYKKIQLILSAFFAQSIYESIF